MKFAVTISTPEVKPTVPVALMSGDFNQKIQKAADLGFDGVELMISDPLKNNPDQVSALVHTRGLEIAALSTGSLLFSEKLTLLSEDPVIEKLAFERVKDLIVFASRVSTPLVTIGSFRGKAKVNNYVQDRTRLIEKLHQLAEFASLNSIRLVLEPLNRYEANLINTTEEALAFVEETHPQLGILLDTYHVNIEEASIIDCFKIGARHQRLWHVHIGDSNRFPPGMGHFNFQQVFSTLKQIGYEGYVSAELLGIPDPDQAAAITIKYCSSFR